MVQIPLRCAAFVLFVCVPQFAPHASGQAYPSAAVRIVVPYPPGGGTDILSRSMSLTRRVKSDAEAAQILSEVRQLAGAANVRRLTGLLGK